MLFAFGDHVLDPLRRELRRGSQPVALEPQVFDLLLYLIANRDRVVTKDDLIDSVWGGRIVSDSALTTRIAAARRAIGDTGEAQTMIRTIARKGFRFVGAVRETGADLAASDPGTPRETSAPPAVSVPKNLALPEKPSIAVLPFSNMSGDPDQDYFAEGIAEDIITALSKWRWFFVVARNSSFAYKGRAMDIKTIGRELGVRYVLEGSTRKVGNRVRITAQLIDSVSGMHVWADRYDREMIDVFAVQDEVTHSVAGAIEPALANVESARAIRDVSRPVEAWDHYLRGTWHFHHYTEASSQSALDCFEQALAIDPNLADAHVGVARVCLMRAAFQFAVPRDEMLRRASESARRALTLDREHATAYYCLAITSSYLGDPVTASGHARRAIAINPNFALGYAALAVSACLDGRHEEAIAANEAAIRLSPNDGQFFVWLSHRASALYMLGRFEDAAAVARQCLSLRWYYSACRILAASLARLGMLDEARAAVRDMLASNAGDKTIAEAVRTYRRPEDQAALAEGLRRAGLPER